MAKKVVHIVRALWPGGVEVWLLRLVSAIDKGEFEIHIIVQEKEHYLLEKEFEKKGIVIHRCFGAPNPFVFSFNFIRTILSIGKTEVVHSHVHHFSGFILFLSWLMGVKIRVAHCHNDTRSKRIEDRFFRKFYNSIMEVLVKIFANQKIAVSDGSKMDLFKESKDVVIMPCGIDLTEFRKLGKTHFDYRGEFKIASDMKVIMHVGRFTHQKNHKFLIDVYNYVHQQNKKVVLCLVGGGELHDDIHKQVVELDLSKSVYFLGVRRDIPALLYYFADAFVFPSFHEGLPVSLIEAQAAGVPCIMSNNISDKAVVNKSLVSVLPLKDNPDTWRNAIFSVLNCPKCNKEEALLVAENSIFNIQQNAKMLKLTYS